MHRVRFYGAMIALVLLVDFAIESWAQVGPPASLVPALVGSAVVLLVAWRDAASRRSRRIVAAGMVVLTGCVAISLTLNVIGKAGTQAMLLAALLIGSAIVTGRAIVESRRRRGRHGLHRYYIA